MFFVLEKCKENGGKIIIVNFLKEVGLVNFVNLQWLGKMLGGGIDFIDLYLLVVVNGDVVFFKVIMLCFWYQDWEKGGNIFDWDFIMEYIIGVEILIDDFCK